MLRFVEQAPQLRAMRTEMVDWEMATRIAKKVAGNEPFASSYHYDSVESDFLRFTTQAEKLVEEETGLVSLSGSARARVADRAGWVDANIASFQRLLRPLLEKFSQGSGMKLFQPVTQKIAAAEIGVMLGWMSTRVLGQYDLLVIEEENPLDQDIVYYVGPNILGLEKTFAFPPSEFRLWIALHEVTHRMQFTGVPWLRPYFLGLVEQTLQSVNPDPKQFLQAVRRSAEAAKNGQSPFRDGGVMGLLVTDEQKIVMDKIAGLMSLLEGHGDITMDRAGKELVPNAARFSNTLQQRRTNAFGVTKLFQQLIGLEAKLNQYVEGEKFIETVEKIAGIPAFQKVWEGPENLPTLVEIRDPSLWISRVTHTTESLVFES